MKLTENQKVEFKESWQDDCLKTVAAFANSDGGILHIGISDDGKEAGVKDSKKLLEVIPNKIRDILGITPKVSSKNKAGKDIIQIEVDYSPAPISYHGKFYVRSGSNTLELKGNELAQFLISNSGSSWVDYEAEGFSMKEIDISTIENFKRLSLQRFPLAANVKKPEILLEKLNLLTDSGKLKRAAVLLFGKNPKKITVSAIIKIGKFSDEGFVQTSDDVEGNLFQQVDNAMTILRTKYLLSTFKYEGLYRKDILEYPEEALREAIINSVIHKDYLGPHIQMRIYQNMIDLWNQGPLPKGISIADLKRVHKSVPRNRVLAETFFKAGLIEGWGQGTLKITEDFIAAGFPPPKFKEQFGGVSVFFHKKEIPTEIRGTKTTEKAGKGGEDSSQKGSQISSLKSSGETTRKTTQTTTQKTVEMPVEKSSLKSREKSREKTTQTTVEEGVEKTVGIPVEKSSLKSSLKILRLIENNNNITFDEMATETGLTRRAVIKNTNKLKKDGVLIRVGPDKGGHWEIVKKK